MAQNINIGVALGASKTGLTIGYRIELLDGTVDTTFTTANVVETTIPGTYISTVSVSVPNDGGLIIWGESGTDYANGIIDAVSASSLSAIDIAKAVLSQSVNAVEDTADTFSLAEIILAILQSSAPSTNWDIYKTDGSTIFNSRSLSLDANAFPVVGVT